MLFWQIPHKDCFSSSYRHISPLVKIRLNTTNSPSGQKGNKMNDRTAATAARFGISEQCAALQRDLLTLPGAVKVEFDLDGFYDHMEQVILLVKFDVAYRNYFRDLRDLRQGVIDTAALRTAAPYLNAEQRQRVCQAANNCIEQHRRTIHTAELAALIAQRDALTA